MKRSCISSVVYYAAISIFYYLIVHTYTNIPFGPDLALSILCALFTGTLVADIANLWTGRADYAALDRAEKMEPLRDGRMEAVIGVIQPQGEPLSSPFQGLPCVAYMYKVSHPSTGSSYRGDQTSSQTRDVTDFSGYGRAPAVIQSGRGAVRISAFSNLDTFDTELDQAQAAQNAETFIQNTSFEDANVLKAFSIAEDFIKGTETRVRKDWRIPPATLKKGQKFEEQVVVVGQLVTALGFYSAEHGALDPHSSSNMLEQVSNRLFNGDGKATRKQMRVNKTAALAFALLGSLMTNGILIRAMMVR